MIILNLFKKKGRRDVLDFFRNGFWAVKTDISEKFLALTHRAVALSISSKPMIALTFDDGPGNNNASDRILDLLSEYNAHATFFMIGKNAQSHPDNVRNKLLLGHEIGSHTWDHQHAGDEVTREDIEKGARAIEAITGAKPSCFRSPHGTTTLFIRNVCRELGVPLYCWTIDTTDWKSKDADKVYRSVVDTVKDGDIVLMHEIYESTAQALEMILPVLNARGFQLVTCRELILAKTGKEPVPGIQYESSFIISNETD